MKILKVFDQAELVLVDLEVNLGNKTQSSPTLCIKMDGKIITLHSAHDGRPILMNMENAIDFKE